MTAAVGKDSMTASEVRGRVFYCLMGISILTLSLAYQVRTPFSVDLGAPADTTSLRNFHEPESAGGLSYRWSGNRSSIVFEGIGAYAPVALQLTLNGHRPANLPPPLVTVSANGREVASFRVSDGFETYPALVGREAVGWLGTLEVELRSETFVPSELTDSGDQRELGVLVDRVSVQFQGGLGTIVVPAPLPVLCLTAAVLVSYLLARWFLPTRWALVVSLTILGGLALAIATIRMRAAPYSPCLLITLGVGLVVTEMTHRTTQRKVNLPLYAVGVAATLLGLWRFVSVAQLSWLGVAPDLANNYHTATILRSGGTIYNADEPLFTGYDNPPLTAILSTPLTLFDLQSSIRFFFGLNTLFLAASVALVFATEKEYLLSYPYWLIAVALILNLDPVLDSLLLGQLDAAILLLIVISFAAFRNGHDLISGASLGLAAMIKFSPALLILYFLLKKRLSLVASAAATALVLGMLSLTVAGFNNLKVFVTQILPTLLAGSAQLENQSLNGFFNRLFLEGEFITGLRAAPPLPLARFLTLGSSVLIVGITVYLLRRRLTSRSDLRFDLEFSLVVITLPIISSIAWHHYQTWYVLPLLVVLDPKLRPGLTKQANWTLTALVALSCLTLSIPINSYAPSFLEGPAKLLLSLRLYSGLTLYAVFAYLLARQSAVPASELPSLNTESDLP